MQVYTVVLIHMFTFSTWHLAFEGMSLTLAFMHLALVLVLSLVTLALSPLVVLWHYFVFWMDISAVQ